MTEKRVNSEQYLLRLPDGMRDALKSAAEDNGRSMNAEIVDRLQLTFDVRWMARTTILDDAVKAFRAASEDMARQTEALKLLLERQRGDDAEARTRRSED